MGSPTEGLYAVKDLQWVPYWIDDVTKTTSVITAESLRKNLRQAWHQGWRYFLPGEESWLFDARDYE
jgi:hypothetical protein